MPRQDRANDRGARMAHARPPAWHARRSPSPARRQAGRGRAGRRALAERLRAVARHRERADPRGTRQRPRSYLVYVQMPDTLGLTPNSKVLIADVYVGQVREIKTEENWGRHADRRIAERRAAAPQRDGQDRPNQPAGNPATGIGSTGAGPVAAAAGQR